MPYDPYGRWYQDQNTFDYREELRKQREAIDYRLSEMDRRYAPQENSGAANQYSPSPVSAPAPATPKQIIQPYIPVDSEKEAREYPIVTRIDDEIGKVHFFAMRDDSAIFAKRINPGTFEPEFEIYDRRTKMSESAISDSGGGLLQSIDTRLQKIEQFVDGALAMFLNNDSQKAVSNPSPKPPNSEPIESEDE